MTAFHWHSRTVSLWKVVCGTALVSGLVASGAGAAESSRTLLAVPPATDAAVELTDAHTNVAGGMLRIETGHRDAWPGLTLHAPEPAGRWDLSAFSRIAFEARNVGTNAARICCRVDNVGSDGKKGSRTESELLGPGGRGTVSVELGGGRPEGAVKLPGMRGYPWGMESRGVDAARVSVVILFFAKPAEDHAFEIGPIRAEGARAAAGEPFDDPAKFFPFIDTFGQYRHRDWPGKTHSEEELRARAVAEAKELAANLGPAGWDAWGGGKAGPQLEATGFFRTAKYGGRWWLVNPDGRLFWSHGVDCVAEHASTPVTEDRAPWFQDFPGDRPEFKALLSQDYVLKGEYAGRTVRAFNFGRANAQRKYGADARQKFATVAHQRLRSWGLNTVGNWSDGALRAMRRTPYVATVNFHSRQLEGSEGYWGQWKDCFDPEFAAKLRAALVREKGCGDPWCLGFFVDNEIGWGDDTSLALAALRSPAEQAAKREFVSDLKAKYGAIEKLNEAWGTTNVSWEALAASREAPDKKKARDDLVAFYARTAEQYFKTVKACVKEAAPHQLYLGCRFAWVNDVAAGVAAKHCDVVSFNLYKRTIADFKFPGGADVPLMVGEFHFGALDRGMFHTGLVALKDQAERAATYREYVNGALRHPQFVGTHWFQYMDESTIGRPLDGENYQIGLVDVCDTPYPETIAAVRDVGAHMYDTRIRP